MRDAGSLGLGPKVTDAILQLAGLLDEATVEGRPDAARQAPSPVADVLTFLLDQSGYLDALRASRDPQDEARAENVDELVAVTKEFERNNPDGGLLDFLTEVSLVAAADELDDSSGTVSLMTLHTAKGLEYDAVFLTGIEEDLLPHRMSANEPGGPAEERRLFYVGITRAQEAALPLARDDARPVRRDRGGDAEPVPAGDPGRADRLAAVAGHGERSRRHAVAGAQRAAPGLGGSSGSGHAGGSSAFADAALRRAAEGRVAEPGHGQGARQRRPRAGGRRPHPAHRLRRRPGHAVTGEGTKRVAHVQFEKAGAKKLLIKIAPIEKI